MTRKIIVTALLAALGLSIAQPAVASSPPSISVCTVTNIRFHEDVSVSADGLQALQEEVIRRVVTAGAECPTPPEFSVVAYGGHASSPEEVDTADLSGQRSRLAASVSSRWTDPASALASSGVAGDDSLNVLLTDFRLVEIGPVEFGPPRDAAGYFQRLLTLRRDHNFVIVGLGGPATEQDQAFAPFWQMVDSRQLGAYVGDDGVSVVTVTPVEADPEPTRPPPSPVTVTEPIQQVTRDSIEVVQDITAKVTTAQWIGFAAIGLLAFVAFATWAFSRGPRRNREPVQVFQLKKKDAELLAAAPLVGRTAVGDIEIETTPTKAVVRKGDESRTIWPGQTVTLDDTRIRMPAPGDSLGASWERQEVPLASFNELTWNHSNPDRHGGGKDK